MMKLKPYPEYKDSGVEWLDILPSDWKVRRAKFLFDVVDIRSAKGEEELLTVSANDGVVPRNQKTVTMFKAESYEGYKLCWPGDLAINSLWAWMHGLGFSRYHGIISSAYGVYRLKEPYKHLCDYFHNLLRSSAYLWELRTRSKGIWVSRLQLTDQAFLDMPLLVPSQEKAEAIVRFLDAKTRLIDRFIRNKRRLIKLLQEQKQAVINDCVTGKMEVRRIVDENGSSSFRLQPSSCKMRDSGIDWLGEIPEHWKTSKLKYLARLKSGDNITAFQIDEDGDFPVYGGNGLRGYTSSYTHNGDYALIGRQGALCGNINYAKGRFWASEHAVVVTLLGDSDLYWFGELLRSMNLNQYSESAAQPGLSVEKIQNLSIPLPSAQEQRQISTNVQSMVEEIAAAISRAQRQIDLIQEYRTRLIADVVTGKVDVRGIPVEDVPEDEALEELADEMEDGLLDDHEYVEEA